MSYHPWPADSAPLPSLIWVALTIFCIVRLFVDKDPSSSLPHSGTNLSLSLYENGNWRIQLHWLCTSLFILHFLKWFFPISWNINRNIPVSGFESFIRIAISAIGGILGFVIIVFIARWETISPWSIASNIGPKISLSASCISSTLFGWYSLRIAWAIAASFVLQFFFVAINTFPSFFNVPYLFIEFIELKCVSFVQSCAFSWYPVKFFFLNLYNKFTPSW